MTQFDHKCFWLQGAITQMKDILLFIKLDYYLLFNELETIVLHLAIYCHLYFSRGLVAVINILVNLDLCFDIYLDLVQRTVEKQDLHINLMVQGLLHFYIGFSFVLKIRNRFFSISFLNHLVMSMITVCSLSSLY